MLVRGEVGSIDLDTIGQTMSTADPFRAVKAWEAQKGKEGCWGTGITGTREQVPSHCCDDPPCFVGGPFVHGGGRRDFAAAGADAAPAQGAWIPFALLAVGLWFVWRSG